VGYAHRASQAVAGDGGPSVSVGYLKDSDRTEVSLTLSPARPDGSRPPFRLITSGGYPGKTARRAPSTVQVNAQPSPLAVIPVLTLVFTIDGTDRIDLAASGRSYRYTYPCDECGPTGIITEASLDEVRRIASGQRVEASVLGFTVELTAAERAALRRFVERLSPEPERAVPPRIVPPVMDGARPK
jgi:hypothetical protein